MNSKISVSVICVAAIIYLLVYNLHDCTFKGSNGKIKFERSRLWQLETSRKKACEGG